MADEPQNPLDLSGEKPSRRPQDYYESIKERFAEERDLRLGYRPEGTAQFTSDLTGALAEYAIDPYAAAPEPRAPSSLPRGERPFYRWLVTIAEHRLQDAIRAHLTAKRGGGRTRRSCLADQRTFRFGQDLRGPGSPPAWFRVSER